MPNIPGVRSSGIPGLGQGFPGGGGALQGLPGALPSPLNPGLGNLPALGTPRVRPDVGSSQPLGISTNAGAQPQRQFSSTTRQRRLQQAQHILDQVRSGHMDAVRAKPMLDSLLDDSDKRNLSRGMLIDSAQNGNPHHDELMAIGFVPMGKNPGQTASMDPTHKAGVGTHLLDDIGNAVVGIPAGMYVAGRAIGEDVKDIPGNLIHGRGAQDFRHTKHDILAPIGHSYAQTYGPAVHGDFGEFAHRLGEHPLGPILDAASVASAGLGAAARTGDALAAVRAGTLSDITKGAAAGGVKVGDNLTVQEMKNGNWLVHDGQQWLAQGPTKEAAIKQAQSLSTGAAMGRPFGVAGSTVSRAAQGFLKGGGSRGRFIDRYNEMKGFDHGKEIDGMVKELTDVLEDPNLRTGKRSFGQYLSDTRKQVVADLKQTRKMGQGRNERIASEPYGMVSPTVAKGLGAVGTTVREAADVVRAGAIYLRPAYLPNNWVGNGFMSLTHQGFLAPVNLGKSFVMDKTLGKRYLAAIDKTLGSNPATSVLRGHGRGYVASLTHPVAEAMGAAADMPFRRAAWLHEARRDGYNSLGKIKDLMDQAAGGDVKAQRRVADIGRRAQEEVVKFNGLNDFERNVAQKIFFVYSWMRGAARYGARYPLQHPIQADAQSHLSKDVGEPYIQKELGGGIPSYLLGAVPVGHDKNGNPILINPFSLNPLGSAVDAGRAVAGTIKAAQGKKSFNQFADTDVVNLLHPLAQSYLESRGGGKSVVTNMKQTIAPLRLAHDLQHPGTGSVFPTSRKEALGHFTIGAMFPRKADEQALQRSMERENQADPIKRLPMDVDTITKAFGQDAVSPGILQQYVEDLHNVDRMKSFQQKYAEDHGQSGFRNMPAKNRAEAAIEFLQKGYITPKQAREYHSQLDSMKTDAELAEFASSLWGSTGIGGIKSAWDDMLHQARGQRLSRARQ